MGSEQLAWARETDALERSLGEVSSSELHRERVGVRIAGDLAQDEVAASRITENERRTKLRSGQIRERKPNQNYGAGCRWLHALSSSGRFQSASAL